MRGAVLWGALPSERHPLFLPVPRASPSGGGGGRAAPGQTGWDLLGIGHSDPPDAHVLVRSTQASMLRRRGRGVGQTPSGEPPASVLLILRARAPSHSACWDW